MQQNNYKFWKDSSIGNLNYQYVGTWDKLNKYKK